MSIKKLRRIAEGLNQVYQRAGGATAIELKLETIRKAIGDSVGTAFQTIQQLNSNEIPRCLEALLPDDEAAFEIRCRNQPQVDPTDPEAPAPMVPVAVDPAAQHRHGHCPRCNYRFTVPGETCPNCDGLDDAEELMPITGCPAPVTTVATVQPKPAEGFQYCTNCSRGEVPLSGGTCLVCETLVDAVYTPVFSPEEME